MITTLLVWRELDSQGANLDSSEVALKGAKLDRGSKEDLEPHNSRFCGLVLLARPAKIPFSIFSILLLLRGRLARVISILNEHRRTDRRCESGGN
jgi:hypothetical protein